MGGDKGRMSVGEFLERRNIVGTKTALELTIEGMAALGVFDRRIDRICELGPGSGRYLERTMARCEPTHYEIYETSDEWRKWLAKKYRVIARQSDWRTLGETETASVDLVQAHKAFPASSAPHNALLFSRDGEGCTPWRLDRFRCYD